MDECKFVIPREILRVAFLDTQQSQNWRRQAPISLDEEIKNKVIRPRVFVDANLVGGDTVLVPLEGLTPTYMDSYTLMYEIPAELLSNRTIISALSISYQPYAASYNSSGLNMGAVNPVGMNDVLSAAQRVMDSVSNVPPISNANVDLVGHNTIVIRDQIRVTNAYQLRCIVANEENLNNINPRSYLNFSNLCVLAVKSYIYNTLIIRIDQAYLQSGQELGSFKNYVESLSDAEQNYQTYLREIWAKTAFTNDTVNYDRFIKLQVNPGI